MSDAARREVEVTITYLEMAARPAFDRPSLPPGPPSALIAADRPPVWYFLALYDAVGRDYHWTDRFRQERAEVRGWIHDPAVTLYTLMRDGWPAGFFVLDTTGAGTCELAYFGLVPEAVGSGLGKYLLKTAVHLGWDRPGVEKLTVETCTLDHPRALGLYQSCGFTPVAQALKTRAIDEQDR
ncbi:GNAT family N-acetyltransferase [Halovulum marinum]|nr:GNAT family N-acetyltransferase [Halovulum marinum]